MGESESHGLGRSKQGDDVILILENWSTLCVPHIL